MMSKTARIFQPQREFDIDVKASVKARSPNYNKLHMARRNRKSRNANKAANPKNEKITAEELQQEKSFFMWAGIITLVIVVGLYFAFS